MLDDATRLLQETASFLRANEDNALLFSRLNALDRPTIDSLLAEYQGIEKQFSPVNLLRYEVLNQLEEGRPPLSPADVELIRHEIEERNVAFFEKYGSRLTEGLANYAKRDPFRLWQKSGTLDYFKLFHPFFYRKKQAPLILDALRQIGTFIKERLGLSDELVHVVDFSGSHRFGAADCWLALFPPQRENHRRAHQLFVRISALGFFAGLWSGRAIQQNRQEIVEHFQTLDEVITFLASLLAEYHAANEHVAADSFQVAEPRPAYSSRSVSVPISADEILQPAETLADAVAALRYKKNLVLQGPPGVGKTFIAQYLAAQLRGNADPAFVKLVQFHQSFSYEDFIQGYRPDGRGGFQLRNGIFYEFCQTALRHPQQPCVLIIDEINRGNLSKIFGELLLLLEADKRSPLYAMPLTYSERPFFIPPNVHVIGTMNTADRSLALVDFALRRRFAFLAIRPEFGEKFVLLLQQKGIAVLLAKKLAQALQQLNNRLAQDPSLGENFCIGHSYFLHPEPDVEPWARRVIRLEIAPLLQEYWFDEPERAEREIQELVATLFP